MSIGLIYWLDVGESLITWPPSRFTRGKYSDSGSDMMMSSFVKRNTLTISRFAENDLPEPGVPRYRPFALFCQGRFRGKKIFVKKYFCFFCKKDLNYSRSRSIIVLSDDKSR